MVDLPAHRTITTDNQSANTFLVGWLLLGWALAIAAIAGITGRLTRRDNK